MQVNGTNLENVTHEDAVSALKSTRERVRLLIAKTAKKATDDTVTEHDTSYVSAGKYRFLLYVLKRSLAVAVIANHTAYDVWYTDKLSNRFRLQVYERLVRLIPMQRVEFMNFNTPNVYLR